MAFPPNSLRAFLSHAKKGLLTAIQQSHKVTIVVGNESADLDSLTSSLLYSYLRSLNPPPKAFTPLYIPLLNIPEADLRIRPEFAALFERANISASHLVTLDDLSPLERIGDVLKPANTRWILVDHNKLQGALGSIYSSRVRGVIDHHEEENVITQDTNPEPRVVEKCGSCTSLVVRTFRTTWDAISTASLSSGAAHAQGDSLVDDSMVRKSWDAQIAKLALASVLIDTTNLTSEHKVEAADREAAQYLSAKIQSSPTYAQIWDQERFYEEINRAKQNIDGLELDEILRKDYKEWTENETRLGISSVVKPLEFLTATARSSNQPDAVDAFEQAADKFIRSKSLSIFAIMTASKSPDRPFGRELFLQATDTSSAAAVAKFFTGAREELELEDVHVSGIGDGSSNNDRAELWTRKVWAQRNVGKSRKQVAPLLRAVMSNSNQEKSQE
ncbi:Exopolyphosphatase [Pseudocyphellaria aurata]|nr:Exopolyphosphatase [Pseudocyphellaria aurata]